MTENEETTKAQSKKFKIRELLPNYGDRVTTMTLEETKDLDFESMVTVFPRGEVVHNFTEFLELSETLYKNRDEVEVIRFAPLVGG